MGHKFVKKPMNSARERIITAAWELFHEYGIDGTSVDDILKSSETGKSQFYHYFGSKDGLIRDVLDEAYQLVKNGDIEGIGEIDTWDDLERWFEGFIDKMAYYECKRACPLGRFVVDLSPDEEALRRGMLLIFEAKKSFLRDFFIKEKAKGHIRADADPDGLANFSESVLQGASVVAKMHQSVEPLRETIDHLIIYLRSFKNKN